MFAVCRMSWYGVCQHVKWQNCFGDKPGCPYGQPKCSKDESLVVRDDFWLSWTTGQPLLRTLALVLAISPNISHLPVIWSISVISEKGDL